MHLKLSLNIEKHPKPCTVGWIKEVPKVKATKRCKVYCYAVDMNACNLLFGRPWHYDVNAWHEGWENIYRFVKDEINFTLMHLNGNSQLQVWKAGG